MVDPHSETPADVPNLEVRSSQVLGDLDSDRAVELSPNLSEKIARQGARQIRSLGGRRGDRVVVGGGAHQAFVFDLATGDVGTRMGPFRSKFVTVLDVSSDGRRALLGTDENELAVYDLGTGELLQTLFDAQSSTAALFFANDGWVVSGPLMADGLRFWDLETLRFDAPGDVRQPLHMVPLGASSIVVSVHRVSTVTWKLEASRVEAWNVSSRDLLFSVPVVTCDEPEKIRSLDTNTDGRLVAVGGALGQVTLIADGRASTEIPRSEQPVKVVRFRRSVRRDELLVLTGDWVLRCFDVSDPNSPALLFEHTLESHGCAGSTWEGEGYPAIAADRLAFRDSQSRVHVCDVMTGQEIGAFSCPDFTGLHLWEDGLLLSKTKSGRIDRVQLADVPEPAWLSPTLAGAEPPEPLPAETTEKPALAPPAPPRPVSQPAPPVATAPRPASPPSPARIAALRAIADDPKAGKTVRLEATVEGLCLELTGHLQNGTLGPPELMQRALETVQATRKRHGRLLWNLAYPLFLYADVHDLHEAAVEAFLVFISKEKPKAAWPEQARNRIPRFIMDPRVQALLAPKVPKRIAAHQLAVSSTLRPRSTWSGRNNLPAVRHGSRVGGEPALPRGTAWPRDRAGKPMHFLAQVRCGDVRLVDWPRQGMLLFFASNDAVMSLTGKCSVLHVEALDPNGFADVSAEMKELEAFPYPPIEKPGGMSLHAGVQAISAGDYRFDTIAPGLSPSAKRSWNKKAFYGPGLSQAGGYPYFTQEDIRRTSDSPDTDVLLLQLDSDYQFGMRWGDNGIVHFFISATDLAARDFSRVRFSGDCL